MITKSLIAVIIFSALCEFVPGMLIGVVIAFPSFGPSYLSRCVLVIGLLIALVAYFYWSTQRRSFGRISEFSDHPVPTIQDILTVGRQCLINGVIVSLVTYLPMKLMSAAHMLTSLNWLQGMAAITIWFFSFEVLRMFTTEYFIVSSGILICHMVNSILIPFDRVQNLSLVHAKDIPLEERFTAATLFILGIRSSELFIVIKWKPEIRFLENSVPLIYLTPSNMSGFYRMIVDRLKT